jgi:hypothetical protein
VAERVIYLDIDDEITSAAARIRAVEAPRVALVLPYGSRVATSRINFRLLSRDALTHEKRLAIVSGDSATRALAASAGLPVFGSVAEYETSVRGEDASAAASAPGRPLAAGVAAGVAAGAAAGTAAAAAPGTGPADGSAWTPASRGVAGGAVAAPAPPLAPVAGETVRADVPPIPMVPGAATASTGVQVGYPGASRTGVRTAGGGGSRTGPIIGIAILALAGLIALVGAYLLLPSASIGVTPQPERMAPLDLTVVADPAATEVDPVGLVVPATSVSTAASANGSFPATGNRVEETKATGIVRFENLDFLNTNTVPAGSIVGTNSGVRFRTNGQVTVPKADIVGLSLFPGKISVKVTAVKAGEDGNVDPNTIVVVPSGEDPIALKVTNPTATSGGTHDEFPRVTQEDVDGALASLGTQLDQAFRDKLTDPSLAPPGTTLFPETGVLGESTPTIDPATLVGQEIESFDLGVTANGSALAVDTEAVKSVAQAQLAAKVEPDHELVGDSVDITVGDGEAAGQTIRFPVTASAEQLAILDADALKAMVLGKSVEEARTILAPFGTVDVSVWPDWMGSIPSFDSRVTLTVDRPVPVERPSSSPSPARTTAPARSPSTAPSTSSSSAPSSGPSPSATAR